MKISKNESGFTAVEAIIIVIIVAVVGFVGYRIYQHSHKTNTTNTTSSSTTTSNTSFPASITNASDVKQASKALQSQPINTKLNPSQLDSYVQKLL